MMGFGLIFLLVIVGAVAYAGGWRPQWTAPVQQQRSPAVDIVRERYARGKISKAEYEQIRRDLAA
jgi:uncharacterized membrane protein